AGGTAQRQNHLQLACAGVIGDIEHGSHHYCHNLFSLRSTLWVPHPFARSWRKGKFRPAFPRPAPPGLRAARFLSNSSASISRAVATLRSSRHPPGAPCLLRRARSTSCCSSLHACRTRGPSAAGLRPQWSWPSWWTPLCQSKSCGGRPRSLCWFQLFRSWLTLSPSQPAWWPLSSFSLAPPLFSLVPPPRPWARKRLCHRQFLLALHRVDAGNVLLQLANLLQALGLSHLQLKLHLEELVRQLALLMKQFGIGQISYLLYIHGSNP